MSLEEVRKNSRSSGKESISPRGGKTGRKINKKHDEIVFNRMHLGLSRRPDGKQSRSKTKRLSSVELFERDNHQDLCYKSKLDDCETPWIQFPAARGLSKGKHSTSSSKGSTSVLFNGMMRIQDN